MSLKHIGYCCVLKHGTVIKQGWMALIQILLSLRT